MGTAHHQSRLPGCVKGPHRAQGTDVWSLGKVSGADTGQPTKALIEPTPFGAMPGLGRSERVDPQVTHVVYVNISMALLCY